MLTTTRTEAGEINRIEIDYGVLISKSKRSDRMTYLGRSTRMIRYRRISDSMTVKHWLKSFFPTK